MVWNARTSASDAALSCSGSPITPRRYGCTAYAWLMSWNTIPYGLASTRWSYSPITTLRSVTKFASSTVRLAMRSASAQSSRSRWFAGTVS